MKNKKIIGVGAISLIIIILSSIYLYTSVIQPKRYEKYMILGNEFLLKNNYQEAVLSFEKSIKIDSKSIEARVGSAKGYVGVNDMKNAVKRLQEAQNLDIKNEDLIIQILDRHK